MTLLDKIIKDLEAMLPLVKSLSTIEFTREEATEIYRALTASRDETTEGKGNGQRA